MEEQTNDTLWRRKQMTITEVSRKYDISQDTLRYYERVGIIPEVERTISGIRNYSEESCRWVELAKCMRAAGIPIESLIEYCALTKRGNSTISTRKDLLTEERKKILEKIDDMQKTLKLLNYKISHYEVAEKTGMLSWDKRDDD